MKEILMKHLKEAGLDIGEDVAIKVVKAIFKAAPELALASENKIDDLFVPVLSMIESPLVNMLDNIYKADNK